MTKTEGHLIIHALSPVKLSRQFRHAPVNVNNRILFTALLYLANSDLFGMRRALFKLKYVIVH
jgi:hypothetical protein